MSKNKNKIDFTVPEEVSRVTETLRKAGFEAYLVGGCVRDLLMGRKPKDWDVTTNARPEEIIPLFQNTFYENDFGTVGVVYDQASNGQVTDRDKVSSETLRVIEVTPYRMENNYSDHRHPDRVEFTGSLQEDLKRRDFTINALAYDDKLKEIIDPYGGVNDLLKAKIIKTVGKPEDRFREDALRMMRAVRFHVELGLEIEAATERAIASNSKLLNVISSERKRDEFVKIIMSPLPMRGIEKMENLKLLQYVVPELEKAIGIEQNKAHAYDVWTHLLKSLQHAADKNYLLHVRLAALFHDIAKPESRRKDKVNNTWTFYGHEVLGSRVTRKILERLNFSRETIDKVVKLVRWHMFFSDTEVITPSAVRRMLVNVGKENIWDLMNVRICDRIGTGRPKENPYRLRKYQAMIEEVMRDPISVQMLKINGGVIMKTLGINPGPTVGRILNALMDEVLEDPSLNNEEYLIKRTKELAELSDIQLIKLAEKGREKKDVQEDKLIKEIRSKHHVD